MHLSGGMVLAGGGRFSPVGTVLAGGDGSRRWGRFLQVGMALAGENPNS